MFVKTPKNPEMPVKKGEKATDTRKNKGLETSVQLMDKTDIVCVKTDRFRMNSLLLIQLESSESVGTIVFSLINQRKINRRKTQARAAAAASGEAGLIPAIKDVLKRHMGIDVGLHRRPFRGLNPDQQAMLDQVLENNLIS